MAAALWTRWEVVVEEVMPVRIEHRYKNSTSRRQPEMSLGATDSVRFQRCLVWLAQQYFDYMRIDINNVRRLSI